ncbi:MAG: hypothetical protein LBG80_03395 [Bacteroidales bacterium]|jgi:hypothetical protein|nr:hypothetical protein [Bacteroidales bacterium]
MISHFNNISTFDVTSWLFYYGENIIRIDVSEMINSVKINFDDNKKFNRGYSGEKQFDRILVAAVACKNEFRYHIR